MKFAIIAWAIFLTAVIFSGCQEQNLPAEKPLPYVNLVGQHVEKIEFAILDEWLNAHRTAEIISLAAISETGGENNRTTHYVIVYRDQIGR